MENQTENLVLKLFELGCIKFGDFTLKSGIKSPYYLDLRLIVSYPLLLKSISSILRKKIEKNLQKYDHICGVPYTALPIATCLSVSYNVPMLVKRKEMKDYGTKKMVEGNFKESDICIIIEDVISSGSSILETVQELTKLGLIVNVAYVLLDREQGGRNNLKNNGIALHSVCTITEIVDVLMRHKKIERNFLLSYEAFTKCKVEAENGKETKMLSYEQKAELSHNKVLRKLLSIVIEKESNLIFSADLTKSQEIVETLQSLGSLICAVKIHADTIEDFNADFIRTLKDLSHQLNFLIIEDRKFCDIGSTVKKQFELGIFKIKNWADIITCHAISGEHTIKTLSESCGVVPNIACFLITEMSCVGALTDKKYSKDAVNIALKYPNFVIGLICQSPSLPIQSSLIQVTPGVGLNSSIDADKMGQSYSSPEAAVADKMADCIIVGRGIIDSENPFETAQSFKQRGYNAYKRRIGVENAK